MRELLKNPKYQKVLFAASKITMEGMVASSKKLKEGHAKHALSKLRFQFIHVICVRFKPSQKCENY
jgi:hypothetical protein